MSGEKLRKQMDQLYVKAKEKLNHLSVYSKSTKNVKKDLNDQDGWL